jgi:peptide/nickel transport system substrate-binding protein
VVKRAALFIKLNDLLVSDNYIQPIISRTRVAALGNKLTAHISGWDNDLWQLASW